MSKNRRIYSFFVVPGSVTIFGNISSLWHDVKHGPFWNISYVAKILYAFVQIFIIEHGQT